jgi:plasmid stability protein
VRGEIIAIIAIIAITYGGGSMASLTIRGLDAETHARLRVAAARHGRSMEAEVRAILRERLAVPISERGLGTRIHERFAAVGGVDLDVPERNERPRAAELDA